MAMPPRRGTTLRWTWRPPGRETIPARMARRRTTGVAMAAATAARMNAASWDRMEAFLRSTPLAAVEPTSAGTCVQRRTLLLDLQLVAAQRGGVRAQRKP